MTFVRLHDSTVRHDSRVDFVISLMNRNACTSFDSAMSLLEFRQNVGRLSEAGIIRHSLASSFLL